MAMEAMKRLEEQVCCSVCLDTYTNPKQLQCHHVFCQKCMVPLVDRDDQGQLVLPCPTCRQVTPIPDRGVAGLPPAFHISNLLELQVTFKKIKCSSGVSEDGTACCVVQRSNSTEASPRESDQRHCLQHPEEELKLYCETCGKLACLFCAIKGGPHYDHEYMLVKEAFERHRKVLASSMESVEGFVATIAKGLKGVEAQSEEVSDQQLLLEGKIHSAFEELQKILKAREAELISQLNHLADEKLKVLAAQKVQTETTLTQRKNCLQRMKESLERNDELFLLRARTKSRVDNLKNLPVLIQSVPAMLKPRTEADMEVSLPEGLKEACQTYGEVFLAKLPESPVSRDRRFSELSTESGPSEPDVAGDQLEEAVKEKTTRSPSLALDIPSRPTKIQDNMVSKSVGGGSIWYETDYLLTVEERPQPICRSFSEELRSPTKKLGPPILTINGVSKPWGVAIDRSGGVVVTDAGKHCVSVFCSRGRKLRSFGACGSHPGQFSSPCGVAVDSEGNILVADHVNHRIQKLTEEGRFLAAVGSEGSGPLQFSNPSYIAFSNHKLYVVDVGNHRVQILNSDLTYHGSFGEPGNGKGQFGGSARGIACDITGKVYVVDSSNHRVQVFTADGEFVRAFGKHGQGRGELDWPNGVAIDSSGTVYVSEGRNNRISVFTSEGRFLTSLGSRGAKRGQFKSPTGLAVDSTNTGVVYVCDYNNSRIQVI